VDPPSFLGTLRLRLVNLAGAFLLDCAHLAGWSEFMALDAVKTVSDAGAQTAGTTRRETRRTGRTERREMRRYVAAVNRSLLRSNQGRKISLRTAQVRHAWEGDPAA